VNKGKANAFIRFTKADVAQDLFAQYGWRPVNPKIVKKYAAKYPARPGVFRISDKLFDGWTAADKKWFDLKSGIMVGIERKVGGPAGS
jgi:ABC-type sulfate transport system substrate-binding protein